MAAGKGWREVVVKPAGIAFDVLEGRFVRMRARKLDTATQRAYAVIDIVTGRMVPPVEFRPKPRSDSANGHGT